MLGCLGPDDVWAGSARWGDGKWACGVTMRARSRRVTTLMCRALCLTLPRARRTDRPQVGPPCGAGCGAAGARTRGHRPAHRHGLATPRRLFRKYWRSSAAVDGWRALWGSRPAVPAQLLLLPVAWYLIVGSHHGDRDPGGESSRSACWYCCSVRLSIRWAAGRDQRGAASAAKQPRS